MNSNYTVYFIKIEYSNSPQNICFVFFIFFYLKISMCSHSILILFGILILEDIGDLAL